MAETKDKEKDKDEEKADKVPAAAIAKAIAELEFRTNKSLPVLDDSTGKQIVENGKPKIYFVPDRRAMTKGDVLNAYYDGDVLVIVSKDGSKYRIAK